MMEVINLKSAIVFRVQIEDRLVAWNTKTFRGKSGRAHIPEPKEHVSFDVHEIALSDSTIAWYGLNPPQRISILWSNVLSVQYEEVA